MGPREDVSGRKWLSGNGLGLVGRGVGNRCPSVRPSGRSLGARSGPRRCRNRCNAFAGRALGPSRAGLERRCPAPTIGCPCYVGLQRTAERVVRAGDPGSPRCLGLRSRPARGRCHDVREDDATQLLEAIAEGRLLLVIGAGLSKAQPSTLPDAAAVAAACAAEYRRKVGTDLARPLHGDLEAMARHFRSVGRFDSLFIGELVPWAAFDRQPNIGHEAIADFLACGVASASVTTNFDTLIEAAAKRLGEPDFRAIVDATDLPHERMHRPLLKLHGCAAIRRDRTVWCREQLADPGIAPTMTQFKEWLRPRMRGRDLMFVGFWSDWEYLCDLLMDVLPTGERQHVYLVDPGADSVLEAKSPALWAWAHRSEIVLHRIQESGSEVLDELRARWSRSFLVRSQDDSADTYRRLFRSEPSAPDGHLGMSSQVLYALRRDLTGTPRNEPVRPRSPTESNRLAVAIHRKLLERGARYDAHAYTLGTKRLRLVSGRGALLGEVRARYANEAQDTTQPETTVCAGALADASPSDLVRGSQAPSIVRPGSTANWVTHESLVAELETPSA